MTFAATAAVSARRWRLDGRVLLDGQSCRGRLARNATSAYITSPAPANGAVQVSVPSKVAAISPVPVVW